MTGTCRQCKETKPASEFYRLSKKNPKPRTICKQCTKDNHTKWRDTEVGDAWRKRRRGHHLRRKYGITQEQYEEVLKKQKGRCAICKKKRVLKIDHCHKTGKFRQLLCGNCNTGLGMFADDPKLLKRAAKYLTLPY